MRYHLICCFLALIGLFAQSAPALAQDEARWMLQTSLYTHHFSPDPTHSDHQNLIGLEYQRPDRWLAGAAFFKNSFNQDSQYLYVGKLWRPFESVQLVHTKLTGGLLLGYKEPYENKFPVNSNGVGLGIVPSIGLSGKHLSGEVAILGTAAGMVTVGVLF